MEWMKYTITTTEEACDLVCSMLNDLGITSLEIEDKAPVSPEENGGYFGDVVPDPVFDDHKARVTFYTEVPEIDSEEAADREEELLRSVGQGLMDISRFADIGELFRPGRKYPPKEMKSWSCASTPEPRSGQASMSRHSLRSEESGNILSPVCVSLISVPAAESLASSL